MDPGRYKLTEEEYVKIDAANKSTLYPMLTKTPLHTTYRKEKLHFDIGHATHMAILEPLRFGSEVLAVNETRRGKAFKQVKADNPDKIVLLKKDYDAIQEMAAAVHSKPDLKKLIQGNDADAEGTVLWTREGQLCKMRYDLYRPGLKCLLDLKTVASAHPGDFSRAVANYGYHAQEAWYREGADANNMGVRDFFFLVVEKEPPYIPALYQLTTSAVEEGRILMDEAFAVYRKVKASGEYYGYPTTPVELDIPRWSYKYKRVS